MSLGLSLVTIVHFMAIPVRKQIYDFTGLPTRGCDDDFSTRKSRKLYYEKLRNDKYEEYIEE